MSEFRTVVNVNPFENKISYVSKTVLMGSCFADNMGEKFSYCGFNNLCNPFGVIYNPISIANLLERALNKQLFTESDIWENNGRWFCFETHGEVAASSAKECLDKHNAALLQTHKFLTNADFLFITFGTAWVYEKEGEIVANCHKIPNKEFKKRLLSRKEIIASYEKLLTQFNIQNSTFRIVFTLSPVRHIKDGFVENHESKSTLHLSIQQLVRQYDMANYFPSYEIMMDDLRDYRFYSDDLLHPNKPAIDYIWEKFKKVLVDDSCYSLIEEVTHLRRASQHRPFNENSENHQHFLELNQQKLVEIRKKLTMLNLKDFL